MLGTQQTQAPALADDVPARVLAMDLGGTKALTGIFEARTGDARGAELVSLYETRLECDRFADPEGLLDAFLGAAGAAGHLRDGKPAVACIALAGPVRGRRARMTNLPWTVDAEALERRFGLPRLLLVNDFAGAAAGVAELDDDAMRCLQAGLPDPAQPRVVLGPGTGLGVALMIPDAHGWRVIPGEGGHFGFSPRSPVEAELWQFLYRRGPRVDAERVICGAGLSAIDDFLRAGESAGSGRDAASRDRGSRAPAAITAAAIAGEERASRALDLFGGALGAFAGDVALLAGARGGGFVAGGMAPRVLDARRATIFIEAFRDKAAHAPVVADVPVHLIVDPRLGLLGAARLALRAAVGAGC